MEALNADQHYNLVVECREGNRKAQHELYKLYSKGMYNVAFRMLNNEDDAADVLQESFLDAFMRIGDFRQESSFGWWIKQIVVNKSITLLRKRKLEFISIENEGVEDIADDEQVDYEDIEFQVRQIRSAIHLLRDNYRVILSLYLLEGYDHEEIGYILNISENTSRTQLLRAKRKLLEVLKVQGMNNN